MCEIHITTSVVKADSILEQTVVKEVNYIEEIPLSNPIILEAKSPEEASKAKAPDPVQNESESHMALNAPKSSGEKLEPTPVSRKKIFYNYTIV